MSTILKNSNTNLPSLLGKNTDIQTVSIDSRSMQNNHKTLFFALVGPNNDGHDYLQDLIKQGVQNFVVQHIPENLKNQANFIVVPNTLAALQEMASKHRNNFSFPIIGITGSNGKTIVKEWLYFLLSPDYSIVRSPKSYNSQVGVPLSVLGIHENHNFGIIEAGISQQNEMQNLASIIQPTIGILTNIGSAHDEGFVDLKEKIAEKIKLFQDSEIIIYQKNVLVDAVLKTKKTKTFSWSFTNIDADILVLVAKNTAQTTLQVKGNTLDFEVEIPFQDDASIENAINCLMVLLYLKYDVNVIQNRIKNLFRVEMRLEIKTGIYNTTLVDDSYSLDIQSLKIALDFLEHQKQNKNKTVILSDLAESGLTATDLNLKLKELLFSNKLTRVVLIGKNISALQTEIANSVAFENTAHFIANFETLKFSNETILIKGARQFQFEKIVALLEAKTHETVLEVNLNAISHNLNYYKSKLKPSTKIMVMVKAFGYGNGGFEIAKLLEHHKVDYLGVAFADEGIALKNAGIKLPIMVLNPETSSFQAIISHQLEPEIYSLKGLRAFIKLADQNQLSQFPIHIKLDTGMHRLGFEAEEMEELIAELKNTKTVFVKSILSHLATSDDLNNQEFAHFQIQLFEKLFTQLQNELHINPIKHILNTSGISNFAAAQYQMVRLGIGLYGVSNNADEQKYLENVSTLKSVISQIRTIEKDESVGYGRRFIASKITKIATIPIGYADGIPRYWGNGLGFVTINNQKASIIGSVCMDMLMVDCTDIACTEGDMVIIFGENPTVNFMATELKTIPYEILTSISQRVRRVFYRE